MEKKKSNSGLIIICIIIFVIGLAGGGAYALYSNGYFEKNTNENKKVVNNNTTNTEKNTNTSLTCTKKDTVSEVVLDENIQATFIGEKATSIIISGFGTLAPDSTMTLDNLYESFNSNYQTDTTRTCTVKQNTDNVSFNCNIAIDSNTNTNSNTTTNNTENQTINSSYPTEKTEFMTYMTTEGYSCN